MTAPRVTPLVWTGRGGYFRGDGPEGSLYGVCEIIPGRWEVDRYSNGATLRIGGYRALDAAKAAAQADYETRILAALEPQDAPAMAEELVALRAEVAAHKARAEVMHRRAQRAGGALDAAIADGEGWQSLYDRKTADDVPAGVRWRVRMVLGDIMRKLKSRRAALTPEAKS